MKSVNTLRGKVKELTRANKNHKRSAHIQALQTQVREHELVVDMLKQLLSDRTGMGRDEVRNVCVLLLATRSLSHLLVCPLCTNPLPGLNTCDQKDDRWTQALSTQDP